MSVARLDVDLPQVAVPTVVVLLVVSFAYSALVRESLVEWYLTWGILASLALTLFVVYLLYRLVVALERIAERL